MNLFDTSLDVWGLGLRGDIQSDLTRDSLVALITGNFELLAVLQRSHDGSVVGEALHALEARNELDGNRLVVLGDQGPEELVEGQVGVRKVELNL
jgi:hypothetical protein